MTDETKPGPLSWLYTVAKVVGSLSAIGTMFLAAWAATYGPVRAYFEEERAFQASVTLSLERVMADVAENGRAIQVLSAPRQIVQFMPATRSLGPCSLSEGVCRFEVVVRRASGAEACQIIPGATVRTLTSRVDNLPRNVGLSDGARTRNIGTSIAVFEINVTPPSAIPLGVADYSFSTSYIDCPWQENGAPPVSAVSPSIPVEIIE